LGANGPEAVIAVAVADHALVPPALALWTRTSIAMPESRPDRSYGLVTFGTVVQRLAPEGLDCRLNAVAALCVLSTGGDVQLTVRSVPEPCASDGAVGALGTVAAVVSVAVTDQGLVPAALALWTWTSIAVPAGRPDRRCGLVTRATVVHKSAAEGPDCRLNHVAAPCVMSAAGAVQVTMRSLPEPAARATASGVFGGAVVEVLVIIFDEKAGSMTAGARWPGVGG